MKFVSEFRDAEKMRQLLAQIEQTVTQSWNIMEICGGQTHSIVKNGLDQLLPDQIELIHGPGCPVCVTDVALIDKAVALASRDDVIFCSFGDMLRVPGSDKDLLMVKAQGGDVRMVYSPLDAVAIALQHPDKHVVFFAVGFETTAPANATAVLQAKAKGLNNFSLLVSHVLVPPAIEAILSDRENRINGFLAAGHVCTVMGLSQYLPIAEKYRVPLVATGFEPVDILQGVLWCVQQLEQGQHGVSNQYARSVKAQGNPAAKQMLDHVFETVHRPWRGMGLIADSGWSLKPEFAAFDAEKRFTLTDLPKVRPSDCISGRILTGHAKPHQCPLFGKQCTPETPQGAPMVSTEGACAAYFRYRPAESEVA